MDRKSRPADTAMKRVEEQDRERETEKEGGRGRKMRQCPEIGGGVPSMSMARAASVWIELLGN